MAVFTVAVGRPAIGRMSANSQVRGQTDPSVVRVTCDTLRGSTAGSSMKTMPPRGGITGPSPDENGEQVDVASHYTGAGGSTYSYTRRQAAEICLSMHDQEVEDGRRLKMRT